MPRTFFSRTMGYQHLGGSLKCTQLPLLSPQIRRAKRLPTSFSMPKTGLTILPSFGTWVFEVNNDNKPAPENITTKDGPRPAPSWVLYEGQEWEWDGIDQMATLRGAVYNGPSLAKGSTPQQKTFSEIFLHLFPHKFFMNVIIEAMSSTLVRVNSACMSLGEMLQYIRMWLLMSCYMKSPK